ncbi:MAG: ribose-5-phosphate isomerase RpiA [candidate division KSB1 bacterium]|nr:ribose-5-phosphate isomerase RpiA [candidate division KSB1 bacterium]MDZ7302066.1 ribose-5-phosphate isomerase RpiA [candidate division KSB1 bacterium]MDZ7311108.1 ribose-5-phosphate isomerase RpiA [candidate division KSB1 bacterium]
MTKLTIAQQKLLAATAAVEFVENKMIIGLGSGTTTEMAIRLLAERVRAGLKITGVPTSKAVEKLARRLQIPLIEDLGAFKKIDLAIDGADEVDPQLNLIKGGGGALTREKIVASRSDRFIIVVDEKKLVKRLGKFPLPVEVLPFGWRATAELLREFGARIKLRQDEKKPYLTDNGNYIVDCAFGKIPNPPQLAQQLKSLIGVVETGLFVGRADLVLVGHSDGRVEEKWAA